MPQKKPPLKSAKSARKSSSARRSRGGPKGVRITDVAAAAGVSPITVSRVFNDPDTVSTQTLQRVRAVVQKLGYVPNRLAGGLSSAKSRLIAAIVPAIAHTLFSEMIQTFSVCMSQRGFQVLLSLSGYANPDDEALLNDVLGRRPEGILLTGVGHSDTLRRRLRGAGIPIVETWDLTATPIDMLVGLSNYQVGATVAERFLAQGVAHPGLVSASDERALARRSGFVDRMEQAGFRTLAQAVVAPPSSVSAGKAALAGLLAQSPALDAVFCSSDLLAMGMLGAAKEAGLAVPSQLRVCGFGDFEFAAQTSPPLTTVRVDGARIGASAAQSLLERLAGRIQPDVVDVGFELIERETG